MHIDYSTEPAKIALMKMVAVTGGIFLRLLSIRNTGTMESPRKCFCIGPNLFFDWQIVVPFISRELSQTL